METIVCGEYAVYIRTAKVTDNGRWLNISKRTVFTVVKLRKHALVTAAITGEVISLNSIRSPLIERVVEEVDWLRVQPVRYRRHNAQSRPFTRWISRYESVKSDAIALARRLNKESS